jgi:hypothetical protein
MMNLDLTPELRDKFLKFHDVYESTRAKLEESGASGAVIAQAVWDAAQQAVPLTPAELRRYKLLVAMHSVNGGELFGNDPAEQ